jgi:hypothetical protein
MQERNYGEGWAQVRRIELDLAVFEPETKGQATVKAEMMHAINELLSARRARLLAASAHLPDAVWRMLIFDLGLVAVYVLFGSHSYKLHMAVTGLTMLSVGLIIALDYPFRGDLSVNHDAYLSVKEVSDRAFESEGAAAARETHEEKKMNPND